MSAATLTTKSQITIPVGVRRALNVEAGDRVEFVEIEPGRFEVIATTRSPRELNGRLGAMIGLVTNVLVRYITQDDPKQSPKATRLIDSLSSDQPGFVPLGAIFELVWVLSSSCGLRRDQLAEALDLLLRSKELVVDLAELVLQAQRRFAQGGADFADCLIERIAHDQACTTTMTSDAGAVKAAGMTLVARRQRVGETDSAGATAERGASWPYQGSRRRRSSHLQRHSPSVGRVCSGRCRSRPGRELTVSAQVPSSGRQHHPGRSGGF